MTSQDPTTSDCELCGGTGQLTCLNVECGDDCEQCGGAGHYPCDCTEED